MSDTKRLKHEIGHSLDNSAGKLKKYGIKDPALDKNIKQARTFLRRDFVPQAAALASEIAEDVNTAVKATISNK